MTKNLKKQKAFTLIELLIVIGILAILIITLLLALNPGEAQKKNRDLARIKHVSTLQTIIDQYISDGLDPSACLIDGDGCTSDGDDILPDPCAAANNWLAIEACPYAQTVPVDPRNNQETTFVGGVADNPTGRGQYWARIVGSNYEVNVRLEAESNRAKVNNDTGNSPNWFEVGNGPLTLMANL